MRMLLAIIVALCLKSVRAAADFDPFQGPPRVTEEGESAKEQARYPFEADETDQ